jgi:hypothetical protein
MQVTHYCGTDTHSLQQVDFFLDGVISQKTVKRLLAIAFSNS